jgi:hypothetical protein
VALLEKRGFLYNHSGDFPQVILIVPSHVPNNPSGLLNSLNPRPELLAGMNNDLPVKEGHYI